jgi:tetratricopeptide (TPR) repeat protein
MAKKQQEEEKSFDFTENLNIEETISRSEAFIEQYKNLLIGIVAAIVLVGGGLYYVNGIYLPNKQAEALNMMYVAERYFEADSLDLAINGDGNFPGFEEIADDYGWTKAGKLANYYLGIAYLRKGQFEEAIDHLEDFSSDDIMLSSIALGATGDAYLELDKKDKALSYYKKAAYNKANNFTSPIYLLRAGELAEEMGQEADALKFYQEIKDKYKSTPEGQQIDKFIARVSQD